MSAYAALAAFACSVLTTGCGSTVDDQRARIAASSGPDIDAKTTTGQVRILWAKAAQAADLPAVALKKPSNLERPTGFNKADIDALTHRALDILGRSAQPALSRMDATQSVDSVYDHQYSATTYDFKTNATGYVAGYDWQWLAASRFAVAPSAPKFIRLLGATDTDSGRLDNGRRARYLIVTLQAHIVQMVPTEADGIVPIVVRRTVRVAAFRPRGGPAWYPSVIVRSTPFGIEGCGLFMGSVMKPLSDADRLREDVADLATSLSSPSLIREDFNDDTDPDRVRSIVEKECKDDH